jgi:hypothetical protein
MHREGFSSSPIFTGAAKAALAAGASANSLASAQAWVVP